MNKKQRVVVLVLGMIVLFLGVFFCSAPTPKEEQRVELPSVSKEEAATQEVQSETGLTLPCAADWSMVWDDISGLWGGMKAEICGEHIKMTVVKDGSMVYQGTLSDDEQGRLYGLAEQAVRVAQPLPDVLPPDFSVINLYLEQGGDGTYVRFPFNDQPQEVKALYDVLIAVRDRIK